LDFAYFFYMTAIFPSIHAVNFFFHSWTITIPHASRPINFNDMSPLLRASPDANVVLDVVKNQKISGDRAAVVIPSVPSNFWVKRVLFVMCCLY